MPDRTCRSDQGHQKPEGPQYATYHRDDPTQLGRAAGVARRKARALASANNVQQCRLGSPARRPGQVKTVASAARVVRGGAQPLASAESQARPNLAPAEAAGLVAGY
jgi:hypothetical protein